MGALGIVVATVIAAGDDVRGEPSNKGMNLTRSAPATGTAALAGYPQCSVDRRGAAMPTSYETAFTDRLATMDDESLLGTLVQLTSAPDAYRPEAIAAVKDEVARRRLGEAKQKEAADRVCQESVQAIQADADRLALEGQSVSAIVAHLKTLGVDEGAATAMAEQAWQLPADVRRRAGRRNLLSGCALCVLSMALILAAWYVAPEGADRIPRGAVFVVLIGFFQLLRGLMQVTSRGSRK